MAKYTREMLLDALSKVFGEKQLVLYLESRMAIPELCDIAASDLFLKGPEFCNTAQAKLIRRALTDIRTDGIFAYARKAKKDKPDTPAEPAKQ